MKKFLALVLFLFSTSCIAVGEEGETVTFSKSGCRGLAQEVGLMAMAFENDPSLTADQLLKSLIEDPVAFETNPEQVKLILKLASMVVVNDKRQMTPGEHFLGANNFCNHFKGNAEEMIKKLKENLNLKDI